MFKIITRKQYKKIQEEAQNWLRCIEVLEKSKVILLDERAALKKENKTLKTQVSKQVTTMGKKHEETKQLKDRLQFLIELFNVDPTLANTILELKAEHDRFQEIINEMNKDNQQASKPPFIYQFNPHSVERIDLNDITCTYC